VTNDGLRVGVGVVGFEVPGALLDQVPEAVGPEPIQVAEGEVSAQLVDRDLEDEADLRWIGLSLSANQIPAERLQAKGRQHEKREIPYAFTHLHYVPPNSFSAASIILSSASAANAKLETDAEEQQTTCLPELVQAGS
jgi:hypothetical protein